MKTPHRPCDGTRENSSMSQIEIVRTTVIRTHQGGAVSTDETGAAKWRTTFNVVRDGVVVAHDISRKKAIRFVARLRDPFSPAAG